MRRSASRSDASARMLVLPEPIPPVIRSNEFVSISTAPPRFRSYKTSILCYTAASLKGSSHAIWRQAQARHLGRPHCLAHQTGRGGGVRLRLDFRFARVVDGTVSADDADGDQHEEDADRHVRDESGDARPDRDREFVCDVESDFRRTHGTRHWARRLVAARDGQKAGELVAAGSGD